MFDFLHSKERKERRDRNKLVKDIIKNPSIFKIEAEVFTKDELVIRVIRKDER